ncbi:MAG TPA: rod shape-determining protein MreC, partial [Bdellovibrionales bacterium]|nr:rod shape-determining protein MreC [Bdellovibrionales bacterium]
MNFFTFDIRKVFAGILLVILPLLAINMQRNSEEELWFTRPFTWAAGAIQNGFHSFSSGVRGTTAMYLDLIDVKVRNRELEEDLARLKAELGSVTELKLENQRLNKLLGFKQASTHNLIAAKIVGRDLLPDHHTLTIDRGTDQGVKKNMAVITTGGVVGYIFRAEPQSSQI